MDRGTEVGQLTLPEALALLLISPEGRITTTGTVFDLGLAGAALGDLALRGHVTLDHGRVAVAKAPPIGEPTLDGFTTFLEAAPSPRQPATWVSRLADRALRDSVLGGLVTRGVLGREPGRALAFFPSVLWPERDPRPTRALRAEVDAVLRGQAPPTPFTTALIGLLRSTRTLRRQFGTHDRARVRSITGDDWVAAAVRIVVKQTQSRGDGFAGGGFIASGSDGGDSSFGGSDGGGHHGGDGGGGDSGGDGGGDGGGGGGD
ncbi:hypothetical protein E9228_000822 [Curtobacterium flaccumfaciens]|uniref:GPP34 family phosphoprotein n=1 Tax=Curtobacterium salicis TaxID=1779862 RepID=A0ABX0T3Y6_9MICO|nr:GPP34 family phosphoprotein [Curtobacterium sp. WW7]NII40203.1 hypothetical protein [Curtobacterium sp. WW7]